MLRLRPLTLFQNESSVLAAALSARFHTSQIFNIKCKRERDKCCEPVPVAIILCGCGALDGTEISEAISTAIHLSQKDMKPLFYAPDVEIFETIDHCTKEADLNGSPRNSFVEAARLARSVIKPLCQCKACKHGGLVIPGGLGATKTMSDFAEKGADCTVLPEVEKLIEDFYCEKKPIASICIASVLIARVLKGVKITLGKESPPEQWPHFEVIKKARDMGAKIELKGVKGITRCKKFNVLSTPAWMYKPATYGEIHVTIGKLMAMLRKCMTHW